MAGQIIISNIKTDSDNAFSILANTGAVLFSANLASGITTGIADNSITNAKLAGSITGDKIATGQITGNLLTANCVSGNNIVSGLALTGNVSVTGNVTVGSGTAANPAISVVGDTDTGIYFPSANTIGFTKGGTEAMRIVQGVDALGKGVLLINGTDQSQSPMVQITGSAADYNLLTIKQTLTTYSTGTRLVMFLNSSDAIAGVISHSGVTSVTYGTSSDERLKENIVDAPNALDKVMDIKVRSYDWKEDSSHVEYGLVAQEVNQVYGEPIGVGGDNVKSDPWNIEYGRLTPILLKAIQEQQSIITDLKARIEALEAQ